jgi:outer membrane biosynthesis protein TonB
VEILGIFRKTESEGSPERSQPGWRRFLSRSSASEIDDSEFRPEVPRPKPNYYRMALGASLTVLVVVLGLHVSKLIPPLFAIVKEEVPSPQSELQAMLAKFHLADSEVKRPPAKLPETKARRKHHGGNGAAEGAAEAMPPYQGTVRAELKVVPVKTLHPFQVEVRDTHRRQKMEVTPKELTIDIDDPQPAMLRETAAPDPSAATFTYYVDLTGPEADRVADVIAPERNPEAKSGKSNRDVTLAAVVDKAGHISSIRRVNGSSALAQAAIDTVRRARYQPFYENGRAVEMQTGIVVKFSIPQS